MSLFEPDISWESAEYLCDPRAGDEEKAPRHSLRTGNQPEHNGSTARWPLDERGNGVRDVAPRRTREGGEI